MTTRHVCVLAVVVTMSGALTAVHARPGDVDTGFGVNGVASIAFAGGPDRGNAVAIQADGKIVIAGSANNGLNTDFAVLRLNANGTPDSTFGANGRVLIPVGEGDDTAYAVAVDSAGRIVVAGSAAHPSAFNAPPDFDFAVVRLGSTGTLDPSFGNAGKFVQAIAPASTDIAYALAVDSADRIVFGGRTHYYIEGPAPVFVNALAVLRLTAAGVLDEDFGDGGAVLFQDAGQATAIAIDPLGRIVVAGSIRGAETLDDFAVLRLDSAGAIDPAFAGGAQVQIPLTDADDTATSVAINSQGRIVIGGYVNNGFFGTDFVAVRLLDNGALDPAFGPAPGGAVVISVGSFSSSDLARAVRVDSSDRIILAGASHDSVTFRSNVAVVRLTAAGALDGTFGVGGSRIIPVGDSDGSGTALALDSTGRMVVAGWTYTASAPPATGASENFLALRLTTGGALDATFGSAGMTVVDAGFANAEAVAMAIQPDNKIVVAGWCSACGPARHTAVARLNADGTADATFGTSGRLVYGFTTNEDRAYALALDASGRILVAGDTLPPSGFTAYAVARLNANGTLDAGFGSSGKLVVNFGSNVSKARAVAVDASGRVILAGSTRVDGEEKYSLARLTAGGVLDASFGSGGKVSFPSVPPAGSSGNVSAILLDQSGRIVLGGIGATGVVARLLVNGALDPAFASGGVLLLPGAMQVHALDMDASGRILAVGTAFNGANSSFDLAVARILASGTLDPSFGAGGIALVPTVPGNGPEIARSVKVVSQGRILVAGEAFHAGEWKFLVARLHSNGTPDAGFGTGGYALLSPAVGGDVAFAVAQQSSGAIVLAGTSGNSGSFQTSMSVVRLLGGGAVSRDFFGDGRSDVLWRNQGLGGSGENYVYPMDGKVILPSEGYLRTVADLNWKVAGVGDFDGDGKADVLWRNSSSGENYVYFMDGLAIKPTEGYLRTVADQNWQVAGVGDFNGDGKDDILWRNAATGENYLYPMNALAIMGTEGYLRTVADTTWQVAGIGDFDGDGKADVLWRNSTTGENYLYPMDSTTIKPTEGYLRTVADQAWKIVGTGDYNGDGKTDVLWRNSSTGENYLYPMDGRTILGTEGYLRTVADLSWHVKGTGDYDGDGKADVLWRNAVTGENYLYPMDGTAIKPTEGYLRTVPQPNWQAVGG